MAYRSWRPLLPPDIELCVYNAPGREARITEAAHRRMAPLVQEAVEAVLPLTDLPFTILGHSMGGMLGYEAARALQGHGAKARRVVVSACPAPGAGLPRARLHDAPDEALLDELQRLGGTPKEVLAHPELMALVLPAFRADLEALFTHESAPLPGLLSPLLAIGGRADPRVAEPALQAWRERSGPGGFEATMFEGGHFFLLEHAAAVLGSLFKPGV